MLRPPRAPVGTRHRRAPPPPPRPGPRRPPPPRPRAPGAAGFFRAGGRPAEATCFPSQEDVLGSGQRGDQAQFLIHHGDARLACFHGSAQKPLAARDVNRAGIGDVGMPRRIAVIGRSGAGKTTVALELGRTFELPVVHLDRLAWEPGWRPVEHTVFDSRHAHAVAADEWVLDGGEGDVRELGELVVRDSTGVPRP